MSPAEPHPTHPAHPAPDLILRAARVIDPSQGIDRVSDVAFAGGRVAAVGDALAAGPATEVRELAGCIVTPGLIDLHTHVYWGGTSIGVDPVALARSSSTATLVDAGTAGPGNFPGFRRHVIEPSRPVRILPFLNLSFAGIFGFSATVMVGESADLRLAGSCIIAPNGEILARAAGHGDEVIVARCDLDLGRSYRETTFNFALHRRVEAYGLIVERTGREEPPANA